MKSRLTAVIVLGLVALQLVTVGVAVTITSQTADASLGDHAAGVAGAAAGTTADLANEYLAGAEHIVAATAGLARQGVLDLSEPLVAEAYLLEQVAADDRIDGMYWASPAGEFVYVARSNEREADGFRTKTITLVGDERSTTLTWRDATLGLLDQVADETDAYDPVTRPWYGLATAEDGVVWTDPYVFYTTRSPGVTAATEIEAGPSEGVIGADVRLAALSLFLTDQNASAGNTAFIVTPSNQLVAHPKPDLLITTDPASGSLGIANLGLLGDPIVTAATGTALDDGVGNFQYEGSTHVVARDTLDTGWEVVVTAPESDLLSELRSSQRTGFYLVVAIALLTLVVTIPLVIWMMRPEESEEEPNGVDHLTDLPNRQTFHDEAGPAFLDAQLERKPISVVMVDLDHFKQINETYGHLTADEIVRAVGGRMRGALSEGDLIARFGGDEFAVLLPKVDVVTARTIAARLRRAVIDAPIKTSHGPVYTTISVGVASAADPAATLEGLIHDADGAMFQAKRAGRDRIEVANNTTVPVRRTTNN
jgi:diguanylate cyclase (GGDEF)-like protein